MMEASRVYLHTGAIKAVLARDDLPISQRRVNIPNSKRVLCIQLLSPPNSAVAAKQPRKAMENENEVMGIS